MVKVEMGKVEVQYLYNTFPISYNNISLQEKDLGVTMNANMKVSEQCIIAASKGNQVLGMIRRNIT